MEVDLVLSEGGRTLLVEMKSGETPNPDTLRPMARLSQHIEGPVTRLVVYGGSRTVRMSEGTLLSWAELDRADELAPFLTSPWAPGAVRT